MKIEVNVSKKYFFTILTTFIVLAGILAVYAYNANGQGGNPAYMGHSADEIQINLSSSGEMVSLSTVINNLASNTNINSPNQPIYESDWVRDNNTRAHKVIFDHNLGYPPQNMQIWFQNVTDDSSSPAVYFYTKTLQLQDCSWFRCNKGANLTTYSILATSDAGATQIARDYNGVKLREGSVCGGSSDWVKATVYCKSTAGNYVYPVTSMKLSGSGIYSNPFGIKVNDTAVIFDIVTTHPLYANYNVDSATYESFKSGYWKVVIYD